METAHPSSTDARMPGIAGILAGILIIILSIVLLFLDLPTLGGNLYGSRGQSVVLLMFMGICCIIVGILEFRERS